MSETESSSAEAPVAETELDVEANAQVETEPPQLDEDGNPIEEAPPEDDSEEIDHDGQKYRIPKALKDSFLRQADYTQKTQALAEERRTVQSRATELAQQAEARQATYDDRVKLAVIDQQLTQLDGMDWGAYAQQYGPEAAIKAMADVQQLRGQRETLNREITDKETNFRLQGEQQLSAAMQEADTILRREVEGFGPEIVNKVGQAAVSLGFSPDEIKQSFVGDDGKADVRTFKALIELANLRAENAELKAKQSKATTAEKQAKVQPAPTVGAKSSGYKPGLNDDLPMDEWLRRRNAEVAKGR